MFGEIAEQGGLAGQPSRFPGNDGAVHHVRGHFPDMRINHAFVDQDIQTPLPFHVIDRRRRDIGGQPVRIG